MVIDWNLVVNGVLFDIDRSGIVGLAARDYQCDSIVRGEFPHHVYGVEGTNADP